MLSVETERRPMYINPFHRVKAWTSRVDLALALLALERAQRKLSRAERTLSRAEQAVLRAERAQAKQGR